MTSITVNPVVVAANDTVNVTFTALLSDGGCDGDFIDITVPPQLVGLTGSFPIRSPDGSVIAVMVVTAGHAVITFNDYLESNLNVFFQGRLKARVRVSVEPDTRYDLEWLAGNEVFVTPVTTEPCDNCGGGIVRAGKFAEYEAGPPPFVRFAINSAATRSATEVVTFTDTVDPGHEINCSAIAVRMGTTLDRWGRIRFTRQWANFAVLACSPTSVTIRVNATATGQYFQVLGRSTPTVEQTRYSDRATVNQVGVTTSLRASARLTDGGGEVDGTRRVPQVAIEKWSTVDGEVAGDYDEDYKPLLADRVEGISFTITNSGNEVLANVAVTDRTTAGTGELRGLVCDFSRLGGPSAATTWSGPFDIGASFTCRGRLPALGPGVRHTNRATVAAIGRGTTTSVSDSDDWNGKTGEPTSDRPTPLVDIEKWSTDDGPQVGDHDHTAKSLRAGQREALTFTITNRGSEPLVDLRVLDRVITGSARVEGLTCDFSPLGGPTTGTRWPGPLEVGKSFVCRATLSGLSDADQHVDRGVVTAVGSRSGKPARDTDDWRAATKRTDTPSDPPSNSPDEPTNQSANDLPSVGLSSRLAPTAGIGLLLALTGVWLVRRNHQQR
ncbi:MAG: Ig-like domain-containing protein [Nocardioides sp.]